MAPDNTERHAMDLWFKGDISLRSLILHTIGCLFVGTPDGIDMPADFYFIEGDRYIPHPNDYSWERQRELLFVDTFRRSLSEKLAKWCLGIALVAFTAGLAGQGLATGVRAAYHKGESTYSRMFKKEGDRQPVSEMSEDAAAQRLRELRNEFLEINKLPASMVDRRKVERIDREAKEIIAKYPSLISVLQGE